MTDWRARCAGKQSKKKKETTTPKQACECEKTTSCFFKCGRSLVCDKHTHSLVVISGACWSQKREVNRSGFFFSVEMLLKCSLFQSESRSDTRRSWRMFAGGQRVRKSGKDLQLVNFFHVYMFKWWLVYSNSGVLSSVKCWRFTFKVSPPESKWSFTLQANSTIHCGRLSLLFWRNSLWNVWEKLNNRL